MKRPYKYTKGKRCPAFLFFFPLYLNHNLCIATISDEKIIIYLLTTDEDGATEDEVVFEPDCECPRIVRVSLLQSLR